MFYTTAGESHGKKIVVVVDDVPSGIGISNQDINLELKRRSQGPGRSSRQDNEQNSACIVAGVNDGKTTGNPVCIEIENYIDDYVSSDNIVRPGHADLSGVIKHNFDDCKNVSERSSARETVGRVVAGVIAKNFLSYLGVEVYSYVYSIGGVAIEENETNLESDLPIQADIEISKLRCPNQEATIKMLEQIDRAKQTGDTLGGKIKVISVGNVSGIGGYSQGYNRLDAKLAAAVVSVPSVKSVCLGSANFQAKNVGSATIDGIIKHEFSGLLTRQTNYSGGIEGGMTNGMPIVLSCCVKPVPTLNKPVKTFNLDTLELCVAQSGKRGDTCVVPNVAVVCESEVAIVLSNEYQNKFGHDNITEIVFALDAYKQRIKQLG